MWGYEEGLVREVGGKRNQTKAEVPGNLIGSKGQQSRMLPEVHSKDCEMPPDLARVRLLVTGSQTAVG